MTALKAHEVSRFLKRPDIDEGIFLVYGPDVGLVHETALTLTRHYAGGGEVTTLDGSDLDADPGRLAVEANTGSLFGERRVIRVRGTGKSLVMTLNEFKDDPGGAVIVLEAGNLTPKDPIRALVEAAKNGRALPCYPDSDETLTMLIRETFARDGIVADPDVVPTLREIFGNDREVTRRELEKLSLFAVSSKILTRNDVLTLCADNAALAIDDIVDAAGTGHAEKLDLALDRAMLAGIEPQRLLATALIHFSGLRRMRTLVDAGKSPRDVLDNARPRPHFSRKAAVEQQLRLWNDQALGAACERLHLATGESRKRPALTEALLRRALLGLCLQVAEH
jgi:DNA polymerase-3 subunit delta